MIDVLRSQVVIKETLKVRDLSLKAAELAQHLVHLSLAVIHELTLIGILLLELPQESLDNIWVELHDAKHDMLISTHLELLEISLLLNLHRSQDLLVELDQGVTLHDFLEAWVLLIKRIPVLARQAVSSNVVFALVNVS